MLNLQQQDEQPSTEQSPGDDSERAAPTRDRNDSVEALSSLEKQLRRSTRRLADLNVLLVEAAGETPAGELLQTEFYFGRPVIRSAVIHRCASEGGRQYAMAWLFEHADPDLNVHLPAGEVTVTADGKAYVSAGCPLDYPFRPQARTVSHSSARAAVEAPEAAVRRTTSSPAASASRLVPRRQHARLVSVPLFLLVVLAGSVFVYRNLIAPALTTSETAAARPEGEPPTVIAVEQENRVEPEVDANTPESASLRQTEEPVLLEDEPAASEGEPAASTRHRAVAERSAPASRPALSEGKISASKRRRVPPPHAGSRPPPRSPGAVAAVQAPSRGAPTVAAAPTASAPLPATAAPPIAIGGTPGDGVETMQPLAKEQSAPPVIAREEQTAPAPGVQRQRQQVAVENTWLRRMRAELVVCGKPGLWRNDICREVTRWRYCQPGRWNTVAECGVQSFPSASD